MPEAVPLDHVALGVPTHADMLIAVGRDYILLVRREHEGGKKRDMAEDEFATGGVLVRCECTALGGACARLCLVCGLWSGVQWVARHKGARIKRRAPNRKQRESHRKTSPNLSDTRIDCPSLAKVIFVGFLGSSRVLSSVSPSTSHIFIFLSSPAVTRCVKVASTAAQRTGPDLRIACFSSSVKLMVEWARSPLLRADNLAESMLLPHASHLESRTCMWGPAMTMDREGPSRS